MRVAIRVAGAVVVVVVVALAYGFILTWRGMSGDARLTVGDHYDVSVRLSDLGLRSEPGVVGLEYVYSLRIRSREFEDFVQTTDSAVVFGIDQRIGGFHDWSLFRELDTWDASRRVALLRYVAAQNAPQMELASTLGESDWPGAWWSENGPDRDRVLKIGADHGFKESELAWIEYSDGLDRDGELLGFVEAEGSWELLARGTNVDLGDSGRLEVTQR